MSLKYGILADLHIPRAASVLLPNMPITRVADYDVRRVVGNGPKPAPVVSETVAAPSTERPKKSGTKAVPTQPALDFPPVTAERGDDDRGQA